MTTKRLTPEQMIAHVNSVADEMEKLQKKSTFVGILSDKVVAYPRGGLTTLIVGLIHEFGLGNNPRRSFLRETFNVKRKEIAAFIEAEVLAVAEGRRTAAKALGRMGVKGVNMVKEAFGTEGFGKWPKSERAEAQGGQTLVDTRLLKIAINWVVR